MQPEAQADAYHQLLDQLGIQKVFFSTSAGGAPAMQFALNYPDRTAGLIFPSSGMPVNQAAHEGVPTFLFNDFIMWIGAKFFSFIGMQQLGISYKSTKRASSADWGQTQRFLEKMFIRHTPEILNEKGPFTCLIRIALRFRCHIKKQAIY